MTHHRSRTAAIAVLAMLVTLTAFVAATKASPPTGGVTATVLARGTFDGFNVRSDPLGPIADFRAHSTGQVDLVVAGTTTRRDPQPAWHGHPGPIFITVTRGSSPTTSTATRPAHLTSSPPATASSTTAADTSFATRPPSPPRTSP